MNHSAASAPPPAIDRLYHRPAAAPAAFQRGARAAPGGAGRIGARIGLTRYGVRCPGRTLRLADGTCVSKPGSIGTDWRVTACSTSAAAGSRISN
jgi:hypothetical protein